MVNNKSHISRKFSSGYLSHVQGETRALAASRLSRNAKDYLPELAALFHSAMRLGCFRKIENFVDYRAQTCLVKLQHRAKLFTSTHGRAKQAELLPEDASNLHFARRSGRGAICNKPPTGPQYLNRLVERLTPHAVDNDIRAPVRKGNNLLTPIRGMVVDPTGRSEFPCSRQLFVTA